MRLARTLALAAPALALAALVGTPSAAVAPQASIAGDWKTADGRSIIRVYQCGQAYCGRIEKFLVAEPAGGARDTENPDSSKRDRKLKGLRIFWDLKPDGDDFEGSGYSPEDGRYFKAQVKREGAKLRVRGCVLIMCRTQMWTKA